MESFKSKLRIGGDVYPSIPIRRRRGQFMDETVPALRQQRFLPPDQMPIQRREPIVREDLRGDGRPGNLTKLDVVYNPPASDQVATKMLGVEKDPASAYQKAQVGLEQQKINQNQGKIDEATALSKAKLANAQKQTEINKFKAEHPGVFVSAPKGGRITAHDKLTGAFVADLGDSGTMDEEARVSIDQSNEAKNIIARGDQTVRNTTLQGTNAETLEETKARHAVELRNLTDKASMERAELYAKTRKEATDVPTQRRTEKLLRAETAKNTHPEWANFIKTVPGGGYVITAPGMGMGKPSREVYDAINEFIEREAEGKSTDIPRPDGGLKTDGKIRVKRKSDGVTGTILPNEFDAAKYDKVN